MRYRRYGAIRRNQQLLFQTIPAALAIASFATQVAVIFVAADNAGDLAGTDLGNGGYLRLTDFRRGEDGGVNLFFIAKITVTHSAKVGDEAGRWVSGNPLAIW